MPATARHVRLGSAAGLAAMLMVGGCAVGPNFHAPRPPAVSGYSVGAEPAQTASARVTGGEAQAFVQGLDIPGQWWSLFQSPAINSLVEQALKTNADLKAANAALRVAREMDAAQRGALFPTVDASYAPSRQKTSATLAPPLNSNTDIYTLHTATLAIAYVPDVFGGVRRQIETTAAQAESQRFQTEAVYLTLTSNVVAAAIQEASLRGQVAATEAVVEANRAMLVSMRREKALGQIASGDIAAQAQAFEQARAALPPLLKQLDQQRHLIAALTGRFPSQAPGEALDLATLQLPRALPVTLPAKLVAQRPDVRAAEANLHAASAQIGVAIANRLPGLELTANAGGMSQNLGTLFANGNGFWSVAGTVTQPVFQGGTLLHRQRAAEAAYDQAGAQYQSTVITAFQNVADTLTALNADADTLQAAAGAEHAALAALDIARGQHRRGEVGSLAVLNAEIVYQQTVLNRVQAQAARYADTAALFQALGGGWWNRDDGGARRAG